MRVQVVYASRHGGTAGIAERIAEVLRTEGADVVVADAADRPDARGFDAYVIGSGVQIGSWHREGTEFLERNRGTLASGPVWLFSSGPLPGSSTMSETEDRLTLALGPGEGPGSGGRRKIATLSAAIHPREHRVFLGAFDPIDPPNSLQERLVRLMPAAKRVLPAGDFREWDAIEAWAREIAAVLAASGAMMQMKGLSRWRKELSRLMRVEIQTAGSSAATSRSRASTGQPWSVGGDPPRG